MGRLKERVKRDMWERQEKELLRLIAEKKKENIEKYGIDKMRRLIGEMDEDKNE